ncbi:hypothetical protein POKO110462_18780 [Pontibacter korlensis]|uniref:Uncharacterized protein n=1 Tax=Pontibacter korlensis TaxID=400092 RepID=A0A0E3ZJ27_9BACT|nr:hypothetical protein [Pontibacter korlensis]AKD04998.1 hypothetical protein PKOR_20320 [Pontibacter korlensis]
MAKNLQYEGIKPEAFDQLKSKLQTYGITLSSNNGSFSEKGVSGKYDYNPEAQVLRLDDLQVGFPASMMVSENTLQARMDELMVQHGGRPLH